MKKASSNYNKLNPSLVTNPFNAICNDLNFTIAQSIHQELPEKKRDLFLIRNDNTEHQFIEFASTTIKHRSTTILQRQGFLVIEYI